MKRMISAILLSSAIWAVCAEERIKYTARDGVNEVSARVRDDGVVEPESITLAYVEPRECVINDRRVVVIDPDEYAILTGRMEVVWHSLHSTADGRRKLHGEIVRTVIEEANLRKLEYHRDGYINVEPMVKKERKPQPKPTGKAKVRPRGFTDAHHQMRQRLSERGKGKTVTVEHDAATGKDTVLEGK